MASSPLYFFSDIFTTDNVLAQYARNPQDRAVTSPYLPKYLEKLKNYNKTLTNESVEKFVYFMDEDLK